MQVKHALVRFMLGLYLSWLFFCVYILDTTFIVSYPRLEVGLFTAGIAVVVYFALKRRSIWAPLVLWLWLVDFARMNPLAKEVHFDYIGWMLLYFAGYSAINRDEDKENQAAFCWLAQLTMGASYTASGMVKWCSPEWQSGEILTSLASSRAFFLPWTEMFVGLLSPVHWGWLAQLTTLLETCALPLVLFPRSRFLIWILLTLLQLGLLLTTKINHVSAGMLIFHVLCFDERWLRPRVQS